VELALANRPVAEEAGGDRAVSALLVGHGDADGQRQAAADDGVAAVKPCLAIEDVHGAAAAAAAAVELAVHLGHQRPQGTPRAIAWPCSR
jgi:hypothetical protein